MIEIKSMATGANEHPCAVAPLGYILVPELPTCEQVLRTSNAFCIHICHRRTSSKTVVELCKDSFYQNKQIFLVRDSLFCDSLPPAYCTSPSPAPLPAICSSISDNTSPYPQDEKKTVRRAHCLLCTVDLVVDQLVFFVIPAVKFTDLLANLL